MFYVVNMFFLPLNMEVPNKSALELILRLTVINHSQTPSHSSMVESLFSILNTKLPLDSRQKNVLIKHLFFLPRQVAFIGFDIV